MGSQKVLMWCCTKLMGKYSSLDPCRLGADKGTAKHSELEAESPRLWEIGNAARCMGITASKLGTMVKPSIGGE